MADRIFTSTRSEETLNALRYATKLEYAALGRIALAYSLQSSKQQPKQSVDFSGKEIRRKSLFGDDESAYVSLLRLRYGRSFSDDEFFSNRSIVKDHIDDGCSRLGQLFDQSAQDGTLFLQRVAGEVALSSMPGGGSGGLALDIVVGTKELNNERVVFELNNMARHANSHLAIMGKPGVGKTQVLLKILADMRLQSNYRTQFIFFDYKGDVVDNDRFVEVTRATTYRLPQQRLPVNPFVLEDYTDNGILLSAEEKTESFASIDNRIGVVQKGALSEAVRTAYERRGAQPLRYPDFREVLAIVREHYDNEGKRDDSLIEILRRLSEFHLFWEHGGADVLIDRVAETTMIVDLHQLPVLKELVAYLVIERLYKEMSALPDSETAEGRRALRTVLVVDEAHNYLGQKNPFLQKIIREGRSKGVVVFFASQSPNDYTQKFFDFKELLEFSLIFQCDGVSGSAVQDLLGCTGKTAKDLQIELSRLRPFQVISKGRDEDEEFTQFRAEPFYKAYQ